MDAVLPTLDRLLRVEIIRHALDLRVEFDDLPYDDGQVLKDEPARSIGVLPPELVQIMADAATDVDEQGSVGAGVDAFDEALLNGVKASVHPCGPALPVPAHVVVELDAVGRVRLQVFEHVELGLVRVL